MNNIFIYIWYKIMFLDLGKAKRANIKYLKIALSFQLSASNKLTSEWVCE